MHSGFFLFQVRHLLKDVDPNFIKQFVLKPDSIFLNCFPVTPNGHRVTELTHAFSNGQRLNFVRSFSFIASLVLVVLDALKCCFLMSFLCPINGCRMTGLGLTKN